MSDLLAWLEKATGPDRGLDEAIALAIGLWKPWLSKHRRWNFEGPNRFEWPANSIPQYDSETGKKIVLTETPWSGWADRADLPRWTESIDAALMLVPEGIEWWSVGRNRDGSFGAAIGSAFGLGDIEVAQQIKGGPALSICIAAMKARAACP